VDSRSLYKTIGTSSVVYSAGIVASRLASFVLLPLYTRYLTPRDYGIMELLDITLAIFAMFVAGRFGDSLFYFYSNAETPEAKNRTVGTTILGSWLVGGVGSLVGVAAATWLSLFVFQNKEYSQFFRITLLSFGLSIPIEAGMSWLRLINRPVAYVMTSLMRLVLAICFSVLFVVGYRMEVAGVLWSNLATSVIIAVSLSVVCLRKTALAFDHRLFGRLLKFSAPIGLGGLAMFVIHSGDRFFLQRTVSLAEVGIYALAYKLGMLMSQVQLAFGNYWTAHAYSILGGEDGAKHYARINTYMLFFMVWPGLAIILFSRPLMTLMITPQFLPCLQYVPWIVAAYVLRAEADYFRMSLYVDGKTMTDAILNWQVGGVCLVGYAVLIPLYKLWGAVAATLGTFILLTVLARMKSYRLRPYALERRRIAHLVGIATFMTLAVLWMPHLPTWQAWSIAFLLTVAYPFVLAATGFWRPGEMAAIKEAGGRIRQWIARSPALEKQGTA